MRFLHLADLHIGKVVNGFPMLDDLGYVLDQVMDLARGHGVDAIVLAGDLYDKSAPSAEAVTLLDGFLTDIRDAGMECFAIPGNHDSSERVAYGSSLLDDQGIHMAPLFTGSITHHTLFDEHGEVTFWLLPFLKPVHVRPCFPDVDIANDYTAALGTLIEHTDIDTGGRNVLVAHQFVTAGGVAPVTSDSETVSVGGLDNVDSSVFDPFDYVALGHIHRPQEVGREQVRYAGSPLKYSFSEISSTKTIPLVTLGSKGEVSVELLPIAPLHDMREIRGPLDALVSGEIVSAADPNDYLRVILTDDKPSLDAVTRIRSAYPNMMSIEYDNATTRALPRYASFPSTAPDQDPGALFERFFLEQNGVEASEMQLDIVHAALEELDGGDC